MTARKLYLGPLTDSRRWDMVDIRPDDVIVVTPPKCGTTWMQTIVALLFFADPEIETELSFKMPWVDIRIREMSEVAARLDAMTHRRSMKSHTPMDGLPLDDQAQYVCVFRHPLDAHFSFRRHVRNLPLSMFDMWYPEDDPDGITYRRFLDGGPEGFDTDAMPLAHILRHYKAAKTLADRPNVSLFHYADMTQDLPGTFAKLADLLDISHSDAVMAELVRAATFENMKANAARFAPSGGKGFMKSDTAFFHSGTSGKWQGVLSDKERADYDAVMDEALTPEDRMWLEYGSEGRART
ncbi:sulfotransferase domain-containing protein [Sulfitobacter aestuariivivens]|uniref:Sulfotransferase domain-containing protein n=1 Tax=Sulfitobacter aestuariivivens TaxID=2766981 RepID=A0A927HEB8_9RHOB|nr:sulfotransferase domain-containing protein [Sulfitobacter aestuariivivens]MBD3664612.1 sulfotransferase domain-containing protein [Sulfitobacter aestuariivivens]